MLLRGIYQVQWILLNLNTMIAMIQTFSSRQYGILKAQRQIQDNLQGESSLGVKFTRNILAWYDNSG